MKFISPFLLCIGSFVVNAQEFSKFEIYQFSDNDSTNGKVVSEVTVSNDRKIYQHDLGYRIRSDRDFFDEMRFPTEQYYFYNDTFLTKKMVIESKFNDTIFHTYYRNERNKVIKEIENYPVTGNQPKSEHWTTYQYDKNGLMQLRQRYYLIVGTKEQTGPIDICYYKYNKQGKLLLDSSTTNTAISKQNEQIFELDKMTMTKDTPKNDTVTIGGIKYVSNFSIKTKYVYFNGGYAAMTHMSKIYYAVDSFFVNDKNLLVRHVRYEDNKKNKDEKYYYDDKTNLKKVVSECFADEKKTSMTRMYKYYK